jgi:positive regulator of sigma E activity
VTGIYAAAMIMVGLLIAAAALVHLVINKPVGAYLRWSLLAYSAMLVVFAIGGIVQMLGTDRAFARAEFVGYLLTAVLFPVGAWWWSRNDRSRAGSAVVLVVALVTPVLIVRIQQVWAGV